jgi:hypothetical protein
MSNKGIKKSKPRKLNVITDVVEGVTCFSVQKKYGVDCNRSNCFHWIDSTKNNNCVLIAAQEGPKTLQEIGELFGLTRMRICQIEKAIYEKLDVTE